MKITARFLILREKTLSNLFTTKNLTNIWRGVVRSQMRGMNILDLHDYFDFNLIIDDKAKEIQSQILRGQYRASSPLVYRQEKRYGICRHLMIPSPSDALVFQTITEHIVTSLKDAQPTDKAYYSRDKHQLKLPHQFEEAEGYPWFMLWPRFQKDIWKFTDDCKYLVVTDVADFFDNIGLRELRHIVSARIKVDEVILDLLFNIIEQMSWTPDYLPTSLKGLPTINLEAFRLLPHVMLFEVDEVLNSRTGGNFVRWMDDINIGVNSKDEAHTILGDTNDVLKSRGLALNLSKTIIYEAAEAKKHFMIEENTYLDFVSKTDISSPKFPNIKARFMKRFRSHVKNPSFRNWDKVTKRYFTVAGQLKITELRRYCRQLFLDYPNVRSNILEYLLRLGFSKATVNVILDLLRSVRRYDDVTLFRFCKLVTDMVIPRMETGTIFIAAVDRLLAPAESNFDLYCYIWFSAKYREPFQLMNLIQSTKKRWMNEQFLARQVVSVLPRLLCFNRDAVLRLLDEQMTAGPRDAASVASNIHALLEIEKVTSQVHGYLFSPKPQRPYPLPKFLILSSVLSSTSLKPGEKNRLSAKVREHITDPWYLHWLELYGLLKG